MHACMNTYTNVHCLYVYEHVRLYVFKYIHKYTLIYFVGASTHACVHAYVCMYTLPIQKIKAT